MAVALSCPAGDVPGGVAAAICRERRPLPASALPASALPASALPGSALPGSVLPAPASAPRSAGWRRWAAAVCAAEVRHATDDFWRCVHRLGLAALFDRDDAWGGHEAPFRLPHEAHAVAALGWLSHLQAHESDRHGPWAAVRWHTWDEPQRRAWLARRRVLWSGFVRQVGRYREARRRIDRAAGLAEPGCPGAGAG
jgi:hypothetical protein